MLQSDSSCPKDGQHQMPIATTGVWDLGLTSSPWSLPDFSDSVPYTLSFEADLASQVAAKFAIQAHTLGMGFFYEFSGVLNAVDDQWSHYIQRMTPKISQTTSEMSLCFGQDGTIRVSVEKLELNDEQLLDIKMLAELLNAKHSGLGWWLVHHLVNADTSTCMMLNPKEAIAQFSYNLCLSSFSDEEYLQEILNNRLEYYGENEFDLIIEKIERGEASESECNLFMDTYGYAYRPSLLQQKFIEDQKWLIDGSNPPILLSDAEVGKLHLSVEDAEIIEGVFRVKQTLEKNKELLEEIRKFTCFDDDSCPFGWTWALYWGESSLNILLEMLDQSHEHMMQIGNDLFSFRFELHPEKEGEIPTEERIKSFVSMLQSFIEIHAAYENLVSRSIRYTNHVCLI